MPLKRRLRLLGVRASSLSSGRASYDSMSASKGTAARRVKRRPFPALYICHDKNKNKNGAASADCCAGAERARLCRLVCNSPKPVEVELAAIGRGVVEATAVNTRAGTVKACRRAKLAPAAGGQIVKLWVKEGDRVEKGQPLLELWNTDLEAQRDLAQRHTCHGTGAAPRSLHGRRGRRPPAGRAHPAACRNGFSQPSSQRERQCRGSRSPGRLRRHGFRRETRPSGNQGPRAGLERTILVAQFSGIVALITVSLENMPHRRPRAYLHRPQST